MSVSYKQIQAALIKDGYPCGPSGADGDWGALSIAACKKYQADHALTPDGVPGEKTLKSLGLIEAKATVQAGSIPKPWFDLAQRMRQAGIDEVGDNAEIGDWASGLGIKNFDARNTPWCGLTVAHCLRATLPDEPLPQNVLGARNFAKVGRHCDPQIGAILVFWRESKQSGKGHVGFYAGEDKDAYHVLGGNQSDAVTITRVAKNRLLEARWPATATFLATGKVEAAGGGGISKNEA